MPKIIDHVLDVKAKLIAGHPSVADIPDLAQAAVLGGIKSTAWTTYMTRFCDKENGIPNDVQLRRLRGVDGSLKDTNRAYLVGNGICGDFTRDHFETNVQSIDEGLNIPGTTADCSPSGLPVD
jgi:hypothetical protein